MTYFASKRVEFDVKDDTALRVTLDGRSFSIIQYKPTMAPHLIEGGQGRGATETEIALAAALRRAVGERDAALTREAGNREQIALLHSMLSGSSRTEAA